MSSTNVAGVFVLLSVVVLLLGFLVEIVLSIREKFCKGSSSGGKVVNQDEGVLVREKTSEKIAVLREDTLGEEGMAGTHARKSSVTNLDERNRSMDRNHSREREVEKVENIFEPKRREKRFKVGRNK